MTRFELLREPAHTGENRCWPCTALNLTLVAVAALAVGRRRRALAVLVAALGALLVWTRGYVVPYTPRVAPRLVAASPVPDEWFDHGTAPPAAAQASSDGLAGDVDGEALLERLQAEGVLIPDGELVDLDPSFRDAWATEMATLADRSTDDLADAVFEVAHAATVSVTEGEERPWIRLGDGSDSVMAETWLSRPVAIAETAAVRALAEWVEDLPTRRQAAGPLRVFLTDCPDCGEPLVESTTMNCCGGSTPSRSEPADVLACPACETRLYTFE